MLSKRNHKFGRGDTLIEVTIAIGIFSLIAVMAVLVVNTSISGTQSALESTVTREEINTQAEALRFIQAAYVYDKKNIPEEELVDSKYYKLWKTIVDNARVLGNDTEGDVEFLSYRPTTCKELYDNNNDSSKIGEQGAFIINTRALNSINTNDSDFVNEILIYAKDQPSMFGQTTSYPRIQYGYSDNVVDDGEALYSLTSGEDATIVGAEGLYIVAAKDNNSTSIISGDDDTAAPRSAFIDFYIRSCWYTMNAKRPSTISTIVRLYNPDY
jgi:type II secretory pathway pseudopilin PulG